MNGVETAGMTAGASAPEAMVLDAINALGRIAPLVDEAALAGEQQQMEFRVPVELLDVANTRKFGKDGHLEHSSPAEIGSR